MTWSVIWDFIHYLCWLLTLHFWAICFLRVSVYLFVKSQCISHLCHCCGGKKGHMAKPNRRRIYLGFQFQRLQYVVTWLSVPGPGERQLIMSRGVHSREEKSSHRRYGAEGTTKRYSSKDTTPVTYFFH